MAGYVEVLRSGPGEEAALVENRYRKVPPVPQPCSETVVNARKLRRRYLKEREREDRALAPPEELNIFKNCKSDVRLQSMLEKEFESFLVCWFQNGIQFTQTMAWDVVIRGTMRSVHMMSR